MAADKQSKTITVQANIPAKSANRKSITAIPLARKSAITKPLATKSTPSPQPSHQLMVSTDDEDNTDEYVPYHPQAVSSGICDFEKIDTNVYSNTVKQTLSPDLGPCRCTLDYSCGSDCLNRSLFTEYDSETCKSGNNCQNTNIQKNITIPVERCVTKNKGLGIRCIQHIPNGTYIMEYTGEVISLNECKIRMQTVYKNDSNYYCLHLEKNKVIDATRMGGECRFVNHSCNPNCKIEKWIVNGLPRMALFAIRDIQAGEELTFDYKFLPFNPECNQICKCESKNCRSLINQKTVDRDAKKRVFLFQT